jgi:hypothetical protein
MKFKPTQVLEMDLMKSLLDNFEKLEQLLLEIEIADAFWLNQQNKSLFLILKKEYHKSRNKKEFSIKNYYKIIFSKAKKTIPNFDIKIYEDFYETDFKFYSTFLNYYQYFKCKRVVSLIDNLKEQFEKSDLEPDSIFAQIEEIKREYGTMLKRKI